MAISQDLLKRVILDQHKQYDWPNVYTPRTIESLLTKLASNKEIIVLSGIRRSGKSTLMEYMRKSKSNNNDYFFNFEDERLVNFSTEDFELLHQTLIALYGEQNTFYFDEIQNIPAWELFVRRIYNYGCKIYITGSNSNLFSEELGTRLTGRYITLKIYPISFAEFSQTTVPLAKTDFSSTEIGLLKAQYFKYLELGGIPEYINYQNTEYLHSLYESILYRDIIARYNISNHKAIKKILFYLASNCGKEMSLSKLLGMINSDGKIIKSTTTIADYCSYIENSFLCFFVNRFSNNLKAQQQAPKKVYFIDHVLAKNMGFRISQDHGHLLENIVFLELKRRGHNIYYYKEIKECDFIVRDEMQTLEVIQVCIELSDVFTKKREIAGLVEAMDKFNLSSGLIITEYEEKIEILELNNKKYKIIVIPIWKWLRNY